MPLSWEQNALDYAQAAWFDRHWMHVGPVLAIVLLSWVMRHHPLKSVGCMAYLPFIVYTAHQFEED